MSVSDEARAQLRDICCGAVIPSTSAGKSSVAAVRFFKGRPQEAEAAFVQVLRADPRSIHRKQKSKNAIYRVCVDGIDAECTFDDSRGEAVLQSVTLGRIDQNTTDSPEEEELDFELEMEGKT